MSQETTPVELRSAAGTPAQGSARRSFLSAAAMVLGLTSAYGLFAAIAARFLYPARPEERRWMFVVALRDTRRGVTLAYSTPGGLGVSIIRLAERGTADDFIALSNVCPHLGCKVNWETQNNRFFCPCHNGAFDADGVSISGPPFDARQNLARYPLKVEAGMLFINIPVS